jgi:flagellar brake protein
MGTPGLVEEVNDLWVVTQLSDILRILMNIRKEQSFVTLALSRGQKVSTMILDVDGKKGHFVYESGRDPAAIGAALSSKKLFFNSTLRGVAVRFTTSKAVKTKFEGTAALLSPLPEFMHYMQRREYFRTQLIERYFCTALLPDGKKVTMDIQDVSVGGVGLQSGTITPELLPAGTVLGATLDFAKLGKVEVELQVTSHRKTENAGRAIHLYGCRFYDLPSIQETKVQRLVFSLEQFSRSNR